MKIFVTGTRGIPDIPGGIEQHCQNLYPLIAAKGHQVFLATRKGYSKYCLSKWKGVNLVKINFLRSKHLEAISHTFIAILAARFYGCDILHIHAIGPGLMVPFARFLRLKVVFTHHGPDYNRQKWGLIAKMALMTGEWLSGKFAHEVIGISNNVRTLLIKRCSRKPQTIYNGVSLPDICEENTCLNKHNIISGKYILVVSRFEPEKGIHLIIDAFEQIKTDYKLVIVGYTNYKTKYNSKLEKKISSNDNVICPGFLSGKHIDQLYTHASLFVLPSYHEGLSIALLEAMSYELSVLVSDIPANREIALATNRYFKCGNIEDLGKKISYHLAHGISEKEKKIFRKQIKDKYNWEKVAKQTLDVYEKILAK